jgi:5-methylcytosine-specific restriction endonuclease McrA
MSSIRPKPVRLRLDPLEYERLRQSVLHRDGWRCQSCGRMANLEIHHREFRSHSCHDAEENLITRCSQCHSWVHLYKNRAGKTLLLGMHLY